MKRATVRSAVLMVTIAVWPLAGRATDYTPMDCAKAASAAQRTVCADYQLGQFEARMATLFEWSTSLVAMGQRGQLLDDQRTFIDQREVCGTSVSCLRGAYLARISRLEAVMNAMESRGPF